MAWLGFFVDENDVSLLRDRLNEDPEIAFIVPDGLVHPEASDTRPSLARGYRQRWKAVHHVSHLTEGDHRLWHTTGGPLTMVSATSSRGIRLNDCRNQPAIPDPWSGWIDEQPSTGFSGPLLNPLDPSSIRLTLWSRVSPYTAVEKSSLSKLVSYWSAGHDLLVASDIQFGGPLSPPAPDTRRWWQRTKRWIGTAAVRLQPSAGGMPISFWAFPSALSRLKAGTKYSASNWNLDASIREATLRRGRP